MPLVMPLVMSLMLLGCAKDGKDGAGGGDQQVEVVNVRFAFSMIPQHSHRAATRMDSAMLVRQALDGWFRRCTYALLQWHARRPLQKRLVR